MAKTSKRTGNAKSIPSGLAIASLISMAITFVVSAGIAALLETEKITWTDAGYWIMGMLYLSSFVGSKFAVMFIKRQKLTIIIMTGILYWGLLLCLTALFFGGDFSAIWETAGIIAAGAGSSALISFPFRKKKVRVYC